MSPTLEISSELEPLLEAEAARDGRDVVSVAQEILRKSLEASKPALAPRLPGDESRLLREINRGPSVAEMEGLAVSRLRNLARLAELRGVDVEQLMAELQIEPPDVL